MYGLLVAISHFNLDNATKEKYVQTFLFVINTEIELLEITLRYCGIDVL